MAIRVLLDHGVREDRIVFIAFVVARDGGVSVLRRAFPGVKIVTGAVDNGLQVGWLDNVGSEGGGRKVWVIGELLPECQSSRANIDCLCPQSLAWVRLVRFLGNDSCLYGSSDFCLTGDRYYL